VSDGEYKGTLSDGTVGATTSCTTPRLDGNHLAGDDEPGATKPLRPPHLQELSGHHGEHTGRCAMVDRGANGVATAVAPTEALGAMELL
jgi:hypothetical protein